MALVAPFAQMAQAQTPWYVATNGTGGGTSWADATDSLQGAINASAAGDTVWVSNGVYEAGGVTNYPTGTILTNRVAIYKAITVQAFSTNPADTLIKGRWHEGYPGGPTTNKLGTNAVRCVWMTNGSTLIGFTLTNGATLTTGSAANQYGGGVYCQSTNTVISNCVLTGNSAGIYVGGAYYGTLYNCTLTGNSASYGGGTYVSTLFNCTLTSNSASVYGGGTGYGALFNCTSSYNSAYSGGGAYYGTLSNCTISSNTIISTGNGGGAYGSTQFNCTLIGNVAPGAGWGGGAASSILSNCTLSGNSVGANGGGGGAYNATLYNCILTNNSASSGNGGGGAYGGTFYNCTLVGNSCPYNGGGAKYGTLYNCKLIGNRTYFGNTTDGGGAKDSTLYNCTVTGNSSEYPAAGTGYGGGVSGGRLINCIVYGNTALSSGYSNWYNVVAFTNTCTAPAATNGVGNITANPLFIDPGSGSGTNHVAGNYRLRNISPPLNAGTNFSWMTVPADVRSKDLDGLRRIDRFSRQVDMGCYELMPRGTLFIIGQ